MLKQTHTHAIANRDGIPIQMSHNFANTESHNNNQSRWYAHNATNLNIDICCVCFVFLGAFCIWLLGSRVADYAIYLIFCALYLTETYIKCEASLSNPPSSRPLVGSSSLGMGPAELAKTEIRPDIHRTFHKCPVNVR